MNDLITIVVPVYNVEKYLPHTLESICGQTYTNLQILLIDDGSTDDSLAVCHKWARQDNRIQVYEQENQGVARTRNKGIQLATGKYVMFLDADDWVEADMLESLYRLAEADHADVVCCLLREENQLEEKDNCTITERTIIHGKNKTESGLALLTVWGPVCKLYRKDLIENIQFESVKDKNGDDTHKNTNTYTITYYTSYKRSWSRQTISNTATFKLGTGKDITGTAKVTVPGGRVSKEVDKVTEKTDGTENPRSGKFSCLISGGERRSEGFRAFLRRFLRAHGEEINILKNP